MEQEEKDVRL